MSKSQFLSIGKIFGVHGVKGTIKIYSYGRFSSFFNAGDLLKIRDKTGLITEHKIKWINPQRKHILVSLNQIESRESAEKLTESEVLMNRNDLPKPDEDEYYWFDIIGLTVFSITGEYIGIIDSIIETGSNDVFVVKNEKQEKLIPAIKSIVIDIDFSNKKITVDLPEGL